MKPVICKYCAETFTPLPDKPGYVNECPECLHEKTAPLRPKPLSPGSAKQRKQLPDHVKALEKSARNWVKATMAHYAACGKPISEEKARMRYDKMCADDDEEPISK
jgi:hypothetical protein